MSKSEMKERQALEDRFLRNKMKIHHITYLVAIELYAEVFERLWDRFLLKSLRKNLQGKEMKNKRMIEVMQQIAKDMENDVKYFEGRPSNGPNIAEAFGKQAAAIVALAQTLNSLLCDKEKP